MAEQKSLARLREIITENLRVQRGGDVVSYVNVENALQDASSRQNHAIFARRGCGKTLLLHHSARNLRPGLRAIYLNCEDFKRHSFPNVLIEILSSLFTELDRNLTGWFGKKKKSKQIIKDIIVKLGALQKSADIHDEEIRKKTLVDGTSHIGASFGFDVEKLHLKVDAKKGITQKEEVERSFSLHSEKLQELDRWLPELKRSVRTFFRTL